MEAKDPFASISELCHVSSSQEDRLRRRRRRFAHESKENDCEEEEEEESEDSREIPTGIIMVSPPDSSVADDLNEYNTPQYTDIFQTPPEGSFLASSDDHRDNRKDFVEEETAGGCTEGEKTVDLGADTDLTLSEVELTQRFECQNEVIDCESDTIRDFGESFTKRKLHFPTEVSELENEATGGILRLSEGLENNITICEGFNNGDGSKNRSLRRKRIEDLEKYRYVGPSSASWCEMVGTKRMRRLAVSVFGQAENARKHFNSRKNHSEITLLDVLRMLAEKSGYDRSLENKSILDVAKSRGMTFP